MAEGQVLNTPQASLAANGTNNNNETIQSLIVVFTITATSASNVRPTFPNPGMGPQSLHSLLRGRLAGSIAGAVSTPVSAALSFVLEALQAIAATSIDPLET